MEKIIIAFAELFKATKDNSMIAVLVLGFLFYITLTHVQSSVNEELQRIDTSIKQIPIVLAEQLKTCPSTSRASYVTASKVK